MFEPCLALPRDPYEARVIAVNLDQLAVALRDWSPDGWRAQSEASETNELFTRLVKRLNPEELDARQRRAAMHSASEVASVLRVLWPEVQQAAAPAEGDLALARS